MSSSSTLVVSLFVVNHPLKFQADFFACVIDGVIQDNISIKIQENDFTGENARLLGFYPQLQQYCQNATHESLQLTQNAIEKYFKGYMDKKELDTEMENNKKRYEAVIKAGQSAGYVDYSNIQSVTNTSKEISTKRVLRLLQKYLLGEKVTREELMK